MEPENDGVFTGIQKKFAAETVCSGGDATLDELLSRCGATREEYALWLEDGRFTAYLAETAERAVEAAAPRVAGALARAAENNVQAMKLYFDVLGKMKKDGPDRDGGIDLLRTEIFGGGDGEE